MRSLVVVSVGALLLGSLESHALTVSVEAGASIAQAMSSVKAAGCPAGAVVELADGVYRELVELPCAGMTLRGQSQHGTVISAANPIRGWERCNASRCPRVPQPERAFRTRVPVAWYWTPTAAGFLEITGAETAHHYWPAQDVDQGLAQAPKSFRYESRKKRGGTVADPSLPALDYSNAILQVHAAPNLVYVRAVKFARAGEIDFSGGTLNGIGRFGLGNMPEFLDAPGEFVVGPPLEDDTRWVYVIPHREGNLETGNLHHAARPNVIFRAGDGSRITIENLTVEGTIYKVSKGSQIPNGIRGRTNRNMIGFERGRMRNQDVTIRNVTVRWSRTGGIDVPFGDRLMVDSVEMYGFRGHVRCLGFGGDVGNPTIDPTVKDSSFTNCGADAVRPWATDGTLIVRNRFEKGQEVHGNGVSMYLGMANALYAENVSSGLLRPVTIQAQIGQITLWRNVHRVPDGGQGCFRQWPWKSGQPGRIVAANNTCLGPAGSIFLSYPSTNAPPYNPHHIVVNNIARTVSACASQGGMAPNAWAVTGPNILWDWKKSWTHRERLCEGYRDHKDSALLKQGLDRVIQNPDTALGDIRIVRSGPAHGNGVDPTPFLPIKRFLGRYDFGIRPGEPINMGAQVYSTQAPTARRPAR